MYLGIDIGTSSIKALLINENQQIIGSASTPIEVARPKDSWSEQDAESWIDAVKSSVSMLRSEHAAALKAVRGIGLSGQMHGATLIGKNDKPLRPCILWNDSRSASQAASLDANPDFREISGNIVFPGFTAPKIAWVAENEPEIFSKIHKILLPKDYVRLWLTGVHASDMSDAAGTAWLDVANRNWSSVLLDASGVRQEQMPVLIEGCKTSGLLRAEVAAEWGMRADVVVAGAADNAAAACGVGVIAPGTAFVSLGTSGIVLAANDRFRPNAGSAIHAFCHALPDTWYQMGVILSATASLAWLASITGRSTPDLTESLGDKLRDPSKIMFLPYLSGERTPHNDAYARGVFAGLDPATNAQDLAQAVIEGVSFALRDCQLALRTAGTELLSVMAVGGGSRSDYWLSLIATILKIPVEVPAKGDFGGAFGAARLAICAATGRAPIDVCSKPMIDRVIEPCSNRTAEFDGAYEKWRRLYPAIKGTKK